MCFDPTRYSEAHCDVLLQIKFAHPKAPHSSLPLGSSFHLWSNFLTWTMSVPAISFNSRILFQLLTVGVWPSHSSHSFAIHVM